MSKPNPHCDAEQGETRVSFSLLYIPAVIALMSVGYGFQQSVTGGIGGDGGFDNGIARESELFIHPHLSKNPVIKKGDFV